MKKQPELTALTKKTFVDTYFDILANNGKPTVEAITKQAGYNRCTFYRYFTDTEHLLYQVETEICDAFQTILNQYSPVDSSTKIIELFAAVYQRYGNYISVLLGKNVDIRFVNKMKEIVYPMAKQLFSTATDSDIHTELKVEFILSAVLATVMKWYDMGQPVSSVQLGVWIQDIIQKGVFK